ncbi:hypothetical protein [Streptomyces hainanensis]|uniref:Secreted protein n=1 Tax=Streptomyces hainanensis TaxID=402648 RepID=A0A4R4TMQ0_9ACTN|nr:hypothetical protein [Streptomyces hainanensis]TDC77124.1 hypothetical protein E1283_08170 [Streptomyces hainanensis]
MARGRHRNAALHRVLIPSALGGSALLCAALAWVLGGSAASLLATVAAFAAVTASALLRRWDLEAGRMVARERAAKAGMSWQVDERQAELEEAQDLVSQLEDKIRGKRADLGRLRSEHADLLRRYATAESERARALEGRRRLALEASEPARELTSEPTDHRTAAGAPTRLTYLQAYEALGRLSRSAARQRAASPEAEPEAEQATEQRIEQGTEQDARQDAAPALPAPAPRREEPRESEAPVPAPARSSRSEAGPRQGGGSRFDFFGSTASPAPAKARRKPVLDEPEEDAREREPAGALDEARESH